MARKGLLGRILSRLSTERVENILLAVYEPFQKKTLWQRLFARHSIPPLEEL